MPATLVLALSMLWLWVWLTASSMLVAVILLGLPMLNTPVAAQRATAGEAGACGEGGGFEGKGGIGGAFVGAEALHGGGELVFEPQGAVGELAGGHVVYAVGAAHHRVGGFELGNALF